MKRMTDIELDARIAQFMDRKKEDFPSLFSRLEASYSAHGALLFSKRKIGRL